MISTNKIACFFACFLHSNNVKNDQSDIKKMLKINETSIIECFNIFQTETNPPYKQGVVGSNPTVPTPVPQSLSEIF